MSKKDLVILGILLLALFIIDYPFLDSFVVKIFGNNGDAVLVTYITDGDTIKAGRTP